MTTPHRRPYWTHPRVTRDTLTNTLLTLYPDGPRKRCTACQELLPLNAFHRKPGRPTGDSRCRACRCAQARARYHRYTRAITALGTHGNPRELPAFDTWLAEARWTDEFPMPDLRAFDGSETGREKWEAEVAPRLDPDLASDIRHARGWPQPRASPEPDLDTS